MHGKSQREIYSVNGRYPILGTGGIMGRANAFLCDKPSVLLGRKGTINKPIFIDTPFWTIDTLFYTAIDFEQVDARFFFYLCNTIDFLSLNEASGVPSLNAHTLENIKLNIPNIEEQRNISRSIQSVDKHIANLQLLIAKQEAIKKSTLKLLLTPKPGWMLVRLGDVAEIITGATPSTQHPEYWDGHIPWLSSGEVRQKYIYSTNKKITMEGLEAASTHMIPRHSIVMALAGQGSTRGLVAVNEIELCTNQSIASIIPHHSFNYLYLFHNLASRYDELREASSGDGGRGGITLPIIHNFEVVAPSLAEQKSIATTLSSLDCHAKELKAELAKAQNIKQGMMRYFFRD